MIPRNPAQTLLASNASKAAQSHARSPGISQQGMQANQSLLKEVTC
jgi:hypothetical protein